VHEVQEALMRHETPPGKCRAHRLAIIVVAGDCEDGVRERREKVEEMRVFLLRALVRQVAGDEDDVRPLGQAADLDNAALERGRRVRPSIGEPPARLDVEIGNLGNQHC
jgi:hypothetical protein